MPPKTDPTTAAGKPPADVEDMYPLSPMQEGMLYETIYAPGSGVYVTQHVSALEGELDVALLRRCWHTVVERHAILRTFFVWGDLKTWAQVVRRQVELPFEVVDLRHIATGEQERQIEQRRDEERREGFDPGRAPLMRIVLLRRRDDLYVSLWTFHHLLLDGSSVALVLGEVFELYKAGLEGREPALPARRPFRDYLLWLQRQDRGAAETFWRDELAGFSAPTLLPFSRTRGQATAGNAQAAVRRLRPEPATEAMSAFAKRHRVTLNTLMQGVWGFVLSRYVGEPDVVFGTAVSGRPPDLEGADSMIGLFVNTFPVRVRPEAGASVAPWLRELQARQLTGRAFEYVPLVDLQAWSDLPPGMPLFELGLNFVNFPSAVAAADADADAKLRVLGDATHDQTDVPWTLGVTPGRELSLSIIYRLDRFDAVTAERSLGHVEAVIDALLGGAGHLGEISLLSEAERRQVLSEWQPEEALPAQPVLVHRRFESAARRDPRAIAAVSGTTELAYGELEERANRLAHALRRLGVGPEVRVGIYLERHLPEVLVALLGVLKAGGAYVALDPLYPRQRLEKMVSAAALTLILSRGELADKVPGAAAARVVCLDRDEELFRDEETSPLPEDPPPQAQVYVVFTSGSSNEPKGVMAEHASFGLRIDHLREMYELGPGDRLLQFCSLSFDASIEEIFPVLTAGATLVQHPAASDLTPAHLLEEVEGLDVNSLHLPPVYWHAVVDYLEDADLPVPPRVRRFITGGEAPSPQKLAAWARRAAHPTRMWNGYGPTEATFGCTTHEPRMDAEELMTLERLPIGRPWPHNRIYVRSAVDLTLLPVGVPGEICCGSEILTRGYLDRPGQTAERFVPDPDSPLPGARMYRTGDLGSFLEDGRLDFLGRVDDQVKVRGVRIEPAEVEAALCEHPRVAAAAVVPHGEGDRRRLVGYVCGRDGAPPDGEVLRRHLLTRLPAPMVPAVFVALDEIPVSPNGKVDRRALPPPPELAAGERRVEAETETERALVEIWRQVLGVEQLGVTDDFFVLGGQSLLAVRMMAQLEKRFGRRLPLAALFEARTIRRLAALLDEPEADLPWQPLVPLQEGGSGAPLYCVHPVGGEVMRYLPLASRFAGERPVYGLQAPSLRDTEDSPSIEALARGYLIEVRKQQPEGPYYLLGWSFGSFVAYEMARQLRLAGEKVGGLYLLDTWAPLFDAPPEDEDLQMLVDLARDRAHSEDRPMPALEELRSLEGEARLERYLELLRDGGLIPEDVSVELARNILRGYRARRRSVEAYRPGPYDGPITLLVAGEPEDPEFLALLESAGLDPTDSTLGWGKLTPFPVEVITLPGRHETLCSEPYVETLAVKLQHAMGQTTAMEKSPRQKKPTTGAGSMFRIIPFLMRNSWGTVVSATVASVIGGVAGAGLIALVNLALTRQAQVGSTLFWVFLGLCLALPLTRFTSGYLLVKMAQAAVYDLRLSLSRRILAAQLRKLEEVGTPRLMAALTEDVMAISNAVTALPNLTMQIAIVFGCLGFLAWLSLPVFGGVFLFLALAVALLKSMEGMAGGAFRRARESQDGIFQHFRALTEGNKELKLHAPRRGAFLARRLEPTAEDLRHNQVVGQTVFQFVGSWAQLIFFGLLGLIIFALPLVIEVDVSMQMSYIITILYIVGPIESIVSSLMPNLVRAGIAMSKVESLGLSLEEGIIEKQVEGLPQLPQWRSIQLQGVTHAYRGEEENSMFTLGPLDLRFEPGEIVFLTGGNGSGKTTLAKILTGLYVPEGGEVLLNGETVTDGNRDLYRQLFSVVFTDFHLFEHLLGLDSPQLDEHAKSYLEKLRLIGKVEVEDGKLSTIELSQGQRKRLALLTAYLEDRSIYLFDEWAADQDPEFKKVFYHKLLPELKAHGKTAIVISHDDHFYHLADRLIKLDEGQVEYDQRQQGERLVETAAPRERVTN